MINNEALGHLLVVRERVVESCPVVRKGLSL